jgi:hypothetical protein
LDLASENGRQEVVQMLRTTIVGLNEDLIKADDLGDVSELTRLVAKGAEVNAVTKCPILLIFSPCWQCAASGTKPFRVVAIGEDGEFGKNRTLSRGNDPRPAANTMATDHVLNIFKHQSLETQMMLE